MVKLSAEHRKATILDVCDRLAKSTGLYTFEMKDIVQEADCAAATIKHYFNSAKGCREAVIKEAIKNNDNQILSQAIVCSDPLVKGLTLERKNEILSAAVLRFTK